MEHDEIEYFFSELIKKEIKISNLGLLKDINILYHYTDLNGLLGIISKKEIWASNIFYLNDSSEVYYGLKFIKNKIKYYIKNESYNFLKEILNSLSTEINDFFLNSNIYIISFCENGNLLSQWRSYGKGKTGVSLGFDIQNLLTSVFEMGTINKVIYDENIQLSLVNRFFDEIINLLKDKFDKSDTSIDLIYFKNKIFQLCSFIVTSFKHPSFNEENEWRLVINLDSSNNINKKTEKVFRIRNNIILPYIAFKITNKNNDYLKEIFVSPVNESKITIESINNFIKEKNFSDCKIIKADIPFRE